MAQGPETLAESPAPKRERMGFLAPALIVGFIIATLVGAYYVRKGMLERAMLDAMKIGDGGSMGRLAASWPSPAKVRNEEGETPLHWAATSGDRVAAEILLDHGADVNAVDSRRWGRFRPKEESGPDGPIVFLDPRDRSGTTILVDDRNWLSDTAPLHRSIANGHWDVARLLVARGADVNLATRGGTGSTPLELSLHEAPPEFIDLLLQSGARIRSLFVDEYNLLASLSPITQKSVIGRPEVVKVLLDHGAQADAYDAWGQTMLYLAVQDNQSTTARLLLDHGAQVDLKDADGRTSLHDAARLGYKEVVEVLLGKGADINAKDDDGKTPLQWAIERKQDGVAEVLRKAGAKE